MANLSIPLGSHLFSPEALQKAVSDALPHIASGHTSALVGSFDAAGAKVTLVLSKDTAIGNWKLETAIAFDPSGHPSFGTTGVLSF